MPLENSLIFAEWKLRVSVLIILEKDVVEVAFHVEGFMVANNVKNYSLLGQGELFSPDRG